MTFHSQSERERALGASQGSFAFRTRTVQSWHQTALACALGVKELSATVELVISTTLISVAQTGAEPETWFPAISVLTMYPDASLESTMPLPLPGAI